MPVYAGTQIKQWVVQPGHPEAAQLAKSLKVSPQITIYGDYDVDGITGVAVLWQVLTLVGADVDYYIPHRIDEGYGLNEQAIRSLAEAGTELLITVDCGVTAFAAANLAERMGLDLIITDHHRPGSELPKAIAVVHPALDESYVNQDSSGSMVAFKLAWAIANEFTTGAKLGPPLREFMINATTLAAMGTVADVVDLRGENRILTSYGLKSLSDCKLCGVKALIESASLTGQGLDSFHIAFRLAPMLNAAGRMGHARLAVELLTSDSQVRSTEIAEYLKEQNIRRQKREREIFQHACEMIAQHGLDDPDRRSIVLAGQNWHTGIIGIVASRIAEKFYRPTIMINAGDTSEMIAQGSARSIPGFCLLDAISACSKHLIDFGGHEMAAGLTIELAKITQFAADFEEYAKRNLKVNDMVAKLHIDATAPLCGFKEETVRELQRLKPFGQGNPRPTFATKGVRLAAPPRKVGTRGDHLQLAIADNTAAVRCIGFRLAGLERKLLENEFFCVAYRPQINNYNGSNSVELVLADVRFD